MSANPFTPAVPVQKKLKVLIYGPSGSGKTVAALSWPRPAVVDAESSTDMYRGRPGFSFTVLDTKNIADLERAIQFVREDKGKSIDTLIIDPITVFYDVLKEATARASKTGELGFREWAKINNRMKGVYNSLTNLPVHVVVIARESVEYETVNGELRKVGQKADSDKAVPYIFDFVVQMKTDHSGVVVKSRGTDSLGEKRVLSKVNWSVFEPIANQYVQGEAVPTHDDESDIERLAEEIRAADEAAQPERKVAGGTTKQSAPPLKVVEKTSPPVVDTLNGKIIDEATQPEWLLKFQDFRDAVNSKFSIDVDDNLLKKLNRESWSVYPDKATVWGEITNLAAKENWALVAHKATYTPDGKGGGVIVFDTALETRWYEGRSKLAGLLDDLDIQEWTAGEHDLPCPVLIIWEQKSDKEGKATYKLVTNVSRLEPVPEPF